MSEEKECSICANDEEKFVTCLFCKFESCVFCFRKHLLSSKMLFPSCMNCKRQFDLDFIAMNTSPDFHNKTYRDHRAILLVEYEKSLLPQTQQAVTNYKRLQELTPLMLETRRNLTRVQREMVEIAKTVLNRSIKYMTSRIKNTVYRIIITDNENRRRFKQLDSEEAVLMNKYLLQNEEYRRLMAKNPENKNNTYSATFVGRCEEPECKGFLSADIENETLKCGLCATIYCYHCQKKNEDEHKCLKEDIDTAKELRKTTKPCPKCASLIFKNGGCDQMFCTSCNTSFDWKTGAIVTKNFHNPHYFEYARRTNQTIERKVDLEYDRNLALAIQEGREEEFILQHQHDCREITHDEFCGVFYSGRISEEVWPMNKRIDEYRMLSAVRDNYARKFPNIQQNDNEDIRVQFLLNAISEKNFLKTVKMREKAREKDRSIHLVLSLYVETSVLIYNKLVLPSNLIPDSHVIAVKEELSGLKAYIEEQLRAIQERFGGVVPCLDDENLRSQGAFNKHKERLANAGSV